MGRKVRREWLRCPSGNLKNRGLHSCPHTGQEFFLHQYTETPSPPPYVYVRSAVLPPIKMFPGPHSIKTFSPKLEVQDDPCVSFFNLTTNRFPQGPSFHNRNDWMPFPLSHFTILSHITVFICLRKWLMDCTVSFLAKLTLIKQTSGLKRFPTKQKSGAVQVILIMQT